MKITKKTDQELQEMSLIEPGQYPFEVIEAEDRISKSGNEMIWLKLKIWDSLGRERFIFDYLLDSMAHKVKHFCDITNMQDKYENENLLATDCLGKSGHLDLIIQKDKTGQYADRNSVRDYVVKKSVEKVIETPFVDDDIPF